MKAGDAVEVTNLDGETAEGTVEQITATTAEAFQLGDKTIHEYWDGRCDPQAPVVRVSLSGGTYSYPADKVRVVE